jgi:rRNA maturation protein Nop10
MYIEKEFEANCPHCGWVRNPVLEEYTITQYCPHCGEEASCLRPCEPGYVCVAGYATSREYGGPEEGGWYYTAGVRADYTVRCFEVGDMPQARLYAERLGRDFSCVRVFGDRVAPSAFPESRPHYC